jgi:hypothetical protein
VKHFEPRSAAFIRAVISLSLAPQPFSPNIFAPRRKVRIALADFFKKIYLITGNTEGIVI